MTTGGTPDRRVLLFSPRIGLDPESGDTSYTEALLEHPPPGVVYTMYDDAMHDGTVVLRGRKPWRGPRSSLDLALLGLRATETGLRKLEVGFREPIWFVTTKPGAFDAIHQHLFTIRQVGEHLPIVSGAGYPLTQLYATRERWAPWHLRLALEFETALAKSLDVHVPWLRPTKGDVMTVYTNHFREWLIERGVDEHQIHVAGTALPDLNLPPKRSDGHTLGFVARDFVPKGGESAIAAFRKLKSEDPRWRLIIATTSAAARHYVPDEPGIEVISDPEREAVLKDVLPRIDVLLAPTRGDCGAPYVVLEALQAHTCVIITDVPWLDQRLCPPAVVKIAASPTDPQNVGSRLADAVRGLVGDDLREAQNEANRLWRKEFSMDLLGEQLDRAYRDAIAHHAARRAHAPRRMNRVTRDA